MFSVFSGRYHSDVPASSANLGTKITTGVLHAASSRAKAPELHFWVENIDLLNNAGAKLVAAGYDDLLFTIFRDRVEWKKTYGKDAPLHKEAITRDRLTSPVEGAPTPAKMPRIPARTPVPPPPPPAHPSAGKEQQMGAWGATAPKLIVASINAPATTARELAAAHATVTASTTPTVEFAAAATAQELAATHFTVTATTKPTVAFAAVSLDGHTAAVPPTTGGRPPPPPPPRPPQDPPEVVSSTPPSTSMYVRGQPTTRRAIRQPSLLQVQQAQQQSMLQQQQAAQPLGLGLPSQTISTNDVVLQHLLQLQQQMAAVQQMAAGAGIRTGGVPVEPHRSQDGAADALRADGVPAEARRTSDTATGTQLPP